jgi:hypothetical protein
MGTYCLAQFAGGIYPFGLRLRAVNDLGNQFVPFHMYLWDLEHGAAAGDLYFNWSSGYGVPFLPDFFSYLMNPFSWLVGLVPRRLVDLPVFAVTLFSIGLGTALMTVFLGRLHPGSAWWRALLAVGYGLSGWVVNDGFADPMWMWGLVSLPLVCLAADWCLQGRRWVLGTLAVAAAWAGNFYTAAMATIGAGLVLLVRLLVTNEPVRRRLAVLARAGGMVAVGILLIAPVLLVCREAQKAAIHSPPISYRGPPPALDVLAQLLPGSKTQNAAPDVFVGVLALLLVAAYAVHHRVPPRERVAWSGLLVLVMLSFLWRPTILLWHGLALPNGSPYRAAFVFTGLLVMVAWLSLARTPRPATLLAGAALTVTVLVVCRDRYVVRSAVWITVLGGGSVTLLALLVAQRVERPRWVRAGAAAVTTVAVVLGCAYSAYVADTVRRGIPFFTPLPTTTAQSRLAYAAVQRERTWPAGRVDTGPHRFADNDPLLLGAEGSEYYSSYVPAATALALRSVSIGWTTNGRHVLSPTDPVARAIMGVDAYLDDAPDKAGFRLVRTGQAAPLVTVHPAVGAETDAESVFVQQQALLGAMVYQLPELRYAGGPVPAPTAGGWLIPPTGGHPPTAFTATCTPGTGAYVAAPAFTGSVRALGTHAPLLSRPGLDSNPVFPLGTVPADGRITLTARVSTSQLLPRAALGCLDQAELTAAVARLRATGATRVDAGGHTIDATLPAGSTGLAVLAVPAVAGWQCTRDRGTPLAPVSFHGFLGVPLSGGASRVACSYEPPGLRRGLLASGAAVLLLLGVAARDRLPARWRLRGRAARTGSRSPRVP